MYQEHEISFKFPLNLDEYLITLQKFGKNNSTNSTLLPLKMIKKIFKISWDHENSSQKFPFLDIIDQHVSDGKLKCGHCNIENLNNLKHYFYIYSLRVGNSSIIKPSVILRSVFDVTTDVNTYSFQIKFIINTEVNYFILDRDLVIGQNKTAIEFNIECPTLLLQFKLCLSDSDTLVRDHGYLHFKTSCCRKSILMRLALERKFTVHKIGKDKCFLHIEWEKGQHEEIQCRNDSRLSCYDILADALVASPILSYIFKSSFHFHREYDIAQCPDILPLLENINLKRRYSEFCSTLKTIDFDTEKNRTFFYCARKLDGTRHLLLLTSASWYILNRNFIAIHGSHLLRLKFNYICHVEFISHDACYYIIDVLQLIQLDRNCPDSKLIHQCISIIAAVQFINNLVQCHGNSILAHSVCGQYTLSCNEFKLIDTKTREDLRQLDHTTIIKTCRLLFTSKSASDVRYVDGYILLAETQILKIKYLSTIDLRISLKDWLKKIAKKKRLELPSSLLQNISQYVRYTRPLKFDIKEEIYFNKHISFVANLLEYYNTKTEKYEKFMNSFPEYKIDLAALNFRSLWFCNYIGAKTSLAYNFQILEFQVDSCNSSMRFNTIRDKPNCNTFIYILNVLKN